MSGSAVGCLLSGVSCLVAVAPPGYPEAGLRVIAVGFDESGEAQAALRLAAGLGGLARAMVRVIAVGARSAGLSSKPATGSQAAGGEGADLQSRLHKAVVELPA